MKRSFALLVGALVTTARCGTSYRDHQVEVGEVLEVDPLMERLPVTIGIYYAPEFRSFEETDTYRADGSVNRYHLRLGAPSVKLFDRVFPALFEITIPVSSRPPFTGTATEQDAVIEPRIKRATRDSVTYEFVFYSPSGKLLVTWSVTGNYGPSVNNARQAGQAVRFAMRNAAAKFLVEFDQQPQIRAWLQGKGVALPAFESEEKSPSSDSSL